MQIKRESFGANFRRFFFRGLGILLPSIVTLWLLWQAFSFLLATVAGPINRGIQWAYVEVAPLAVGPHLLPEFVPGSGDVPPRGWFVHGKPKESLQHLHERWAERWYLNGIGLLVAMGLVYLVGVILGGFFGRQFYGRIEALIGRIPGFKQIYPHVKQVVDLVIGDKAMAFNRVVLVEWPRKEVWTLGFVTGGSIEGARRAAGANVVSVFIPHTPTPFTGFVVNMRESEVIDMPMSIDEALRFVITAGVLTPDKARQHLSPLDRPGTPTMVPAPAPVEPANG